MRRSVEDVIDVFKTNVLGPLQVTQAMLPLIRKGNRKLVSSTIIQYTSHGKYHLNHAWHTCFMKCNVLISTACCMQIINTSSGDGSIKILSDMGLHNEKQRKEDPHGRSLLPYKMAKVRHCF